MIISDQIWLILWHLPIKHFRSNIISFVFDDVINIDVMYNVGSDNTELRWLIESVGNDNNNRLMCHLWLDFNWLTTLIGIWSWHFFWLFLNISDLSFVIKIFYFFIVLYVISDLLKFNPSNSIKLRSKTKFSRCFKDLCRSGRTTTGLIGLMAVENDNDNRSINMSFIKRL